MTTTTYAETLEYLFSQLPMFQRQGRAAFKKDLTNIIALCDRLGNPQNSFKSIHIAGTNGKGSTAHILSALLTIHYKKVGIYTSPHFRDYRERIKIGSRLISEDDVVHFVNIIKESIKDIQPSFFEITVAMAFWYFEKEKVDIAVIETGLGGRLDSTNVITPELSIITNIDFDHMEFLGDTLQEIALEKAGIIKSGVPVIVGKNQTETHLIFKVKARQKSSPIHYAEDMIQLNQLSDENDSIEYQFESNGEGFSFHTNLTSGVQKQNLTTAIASFIFYQKNQSLPTLSQDHLREVMRDIPRCMGMMGRWQILSKKPHVIADGAHNEAGLRSLFKDVGRMKYRRLIVVFGVVEDKNLERALNQLPSKATYITCEAAIPRAKDVGQLTNVMKMRGFQVRAGGSVKEGLSIAMKLATPEDLILVTGSMFVVADIV